MKVTWRSKELSALTDFELEHAIEEVGDLANDLQRRLQNYAIPPVQERRNLEIYQLALMKLKEVKNV